MAEYDPDASARAEASINRGELSPQRPYFMAILTPNTPGNNVVGMIIDGWTDKKDVGMDTYELMYLDGGKPKTVMYAGGGSLMLMNHDEELFMQHLQTAVENIRFHGGQLLASTLQIDNVFETDFLLDELFPEEEAYPLREAA